MKEGVRGRGRQIDDGSQPNWLPQHQPRAFSPCEGWEGATVRREPSEQVVPPPQPSANDGFFISISRRHCGILIALILMVHFPFSAGTGRTGGQPAVPALLTLCQGAAVNSVHQPPLHLHLPSPVC